VLAQVSSTRATIATLAPHFNHSAGSAEIELFPRVELGIASGWRPLLAPLSANKLRAFAHPGSSFVCKTCVGQPLIRSNQGKLGDENLPWRHTMGGNELALAAVCAR